MDKLRHTQVSWPAETTEPGAELVSNPGGFHCDLSGYPLHAQRRHLPGFPGVLCPHTDTPSPFLTAGDTGVVLPEGRETGAGGLGFFSFETFPTFSTQAHTAVLMGQHPL